MPELTLPAAKEVVAKAIEHEAWSWDDPASVTDEAVMDTAKQLVEISQQASKGGSVADAVMEILFAAQVEPLSEPSREAYTRRFGDKASSNGHAEVESAAPAPSAESSPASSVSSPTADESSSAPADVDISDIYPGYDDQKVAEIKKAVLHFAAIGELSPEEWEQIKAYEAAHEERKSVLSLQPEFKQPEPEPAPGDVMEAAGEAQSGAFSKQPDLVSGEAAQAMAEATREQISSSLDSSDGVANFYAGKTQSRAQQEGLPLPAQVDFGQTPPVLPINITSTDDGELSRIATQFHSCFARAQWALSQEEGRRDAAEHLEREAERDAYVQAYERHKSAIPEDKQHQPTALEAARKAAEKDAETTVHVRTYRSRKIHHSISARELKALASGYDKAVWRINEELDRRARLQTSRPS